MSNYGSVVQQIQDLFNDGYSTETIAQVIKQQSGVVLSERYIDDVIDEYVMQP